MNNELNRELIVECEKGNLKRVEELLLEGADINFRWDVHTYNKDEILPNLIKVSECGLLQEVQCAGTVNSETGEMYHGDRVCPLDIALGHVGEEQKIEPNMDLLILLLSNNVDIEKAHNYSKYNKDDLNLIIKTLDYIKLDLKLDNKNYITKKKKI